MAAKAPLGVALGDVANEAEVGGEPAGGVREKEGGGEVEGERNHEAAEDGGTWEVDDMNEAVGEDAAFEAGDGKRVAPEHVAGKEGEGGGSEDKPEGDPGDFGGGGAYAAGAHPRDADAHKGERKEEDGDAEGLEQDVGCVRADEADPIVGEAGGACGCGSATTNGVKRGVGGRVADEGEEEEASGDQHGETEHLVETAAASWGVGESFGLHRCLGAAEREPCSREAARKAARDRTTRAALLFHSWGYGAGWNQSGD